MTDADVVIVVVAAVGILAVIGVAWFVASRPESPSGFVPTRAEYDASKFLDGAEKPRRWATVSDERPRHVERVTNVVYPPLTPVAPSPSRSADDGFLTSMAVAMATDNALLGAAVGGNITGGLVGASLAEGMHHSSGHAPSFEHHAPSFDPAPVADYCPPAPSFEPSSCDVSTSSSFDSGPSSSFDGGSCGSFDGGSSSSGSDGW